jgi:hypothetical protein
MSPCRPKIRLDKYERVHTERSALHFSDFVRGRQI